MNLENRYFRLEKSTKVLIVKLRINYSRILAHKYRRKVVKRNGESVISRSVKKNIKEYARDRFGKAAYWPYLALYTEIRGQFIKGWIPYDYFRYIILPRINPPPDTAIGNNKTFDHILFGDFSIKPLFVHISGNFYNSDFEIVPISEVKKFFIDYNDAIVVKEDKGTHGKQVRFIHSSEFVPEGLSKSINYVIQPYIKQYKVLDNLYPDSVNTFRVTTYIENDGSVTVKFISLRFGVDGSKIDNVSSGGHAISFDLFGKPAKMAHGSKGFVNGDKHKNTGYLYSNLKFPMFNEILSKCMSAHNKYPYTRLIGWDVCITKSGEPKLIEWNAENPAFLDPEAVFGPFWADDEEIVSLSK